MELETFERKAFNKKRANALFLVHLLDRGHSKAEDAKYKPFLLAAGFSQSDITLLKTLSTELNEAFSERDRFVDASGSRTQERIEAFNKFWRHMVLISKAARLTYPKESAKAESYKLYPKKRGRPKRRKKKLVESN